VQNVPDAVASDNMEWEDLVEPTCSSRDDRPACSSRGELLPCSSRGEMVPCSSRGVEDPVWGSMDEVLADEEDGPGSDGEAAVSDGPVKSKRIGFIRNRNRN
jgi:hypothetical protein